MWGFALAAFILLTDQVTKALITVSMTPNQSIPLIGDLLQLTYIRNPASAFGLDLAPSWFNVIFGVVASLVIAWYMIRLPKREYWPRIALAMILAGALGNLVDRVRFGDVVDFIHVGLSSRVVWPIFNVADMGVSVGVTLLMLYFIVIGEPDQRDAQLDS